jgi:cholesterol transport system auxiliary component
MKTLAPLMLPFALAGCISFAAKPPKTLLTIAPTAQVPVGRVLTSSSAPTITIGVPSFPQELATLRIPVRSNGAAIAYVKDAQWVEPPARLFARLLSDTVTANTGRVVLSGRQSVIDPGAQLTGELREFSIEVGGATPTAVVVYDASLMRGEEPVFEKQRFEARVPVTGQVTAAASGAALGEAANQVAAQVATWVGN